MTVWPYITPHPRPHQVSLEAVEKTIRDAKAASEARVMSPEEPLVALSAKTAAIANASDGPRGLLAQFPPRVLRMAFGEVSAAGDFEQLRQLLVGSFGQYIDAPCERDGSRRTPLHWAVHGGHVDCVRLLLRRDVLRQYPIRRRLRHWAGAPPALRCTTVVLR